MWSINVLWGFKRVREPGKIKTKSKGRIPSSMLPGIPPLRKKCARIGHRSVKKQSHLNNFTL
jgi:hypothetical protein